MNYLPPRGTLLDLPLIQERYGRAFLASIAIHGLLLAFFLLAPFLMPQMSPITLGTGPGGGGGGESYTVAVADDLGGGTGLFKPATTPQPPALPVEKASKKEIKKEETSAAVPLPDIAAAKKNKKAVEPASKAAKPIPEPAAGVIPVAGSKGAGGTGAATAGTGTGVGGGTGVSIGTGSGGAMDSYYARTVETRVSQNWLRPVDVPQRIEIVYSFLVDSDGRIDPDKIVLEKSSGIEALDLTAMRAIRASSPLAQPPPELRGKPIQFRCQFVYPPDRQ